MMNKPSGTITLNMSTVFYTLLYSFFTVCSILYINTSVHTFEEVVDSLSIYLLVLLLVQSIIGYRCFGGISFSLIFIWCCHLFWLSQNFLLFIKYDFGKQIYYLAYLNYGTVPYVKAMIYSTYAVLLTFLGMLVKRTTTKNHNFEKKEQYQTHINRKNLIPLVVFCFLIDFYQTASRIAVLISQGYESSHDAGEISNVLKTFTQIFPVAMFLLIVSYKDNRRVARKLFYIFMIYEIVKMLGGARAYALLGIIVITLMYYKYIEHLNIKRLLIVLLGAFLILQVLVVIRYGRFYGSYNFQIIGLSGLALETMKEFGLTIRAIARGFYMMDYHANGMGVVTSLLLCIPKYSAMFGEQLIQRYYTYFAFDFKQFGSAFPIEFYFDFGYIGGLIACFVFGMIFCSVERRIHEHMSAGKYIYCGFWLFVMTELLYTVRSYPIRLPRYIVYFAVIYFAYDYFFLRKKAKLRNLE